MKGKAESNSDQKTNKMILIGVLIYGLLAFLIGEFFGRAKHIGRWWTMLLFWSAPIPIIGLLALIFSPPAKKPPTSKRNFIQIALGSIFFLLSIGFLINIFNSSGYVLHFSFIYFTAFFIHGIYFILLGSGKVINSNPKYYFNKINFQKFKEKIKQENKKLSKSNTDTYYFIIINNEQKGPYNFEELKKIRISSNTLIWRKGLKNWNKADELDEIESIIVFMPPPLRDSEITKNIMSDEIVEQKFENKDLIKNVISVTNDDIKENQEKKTKSIVIDERSDKLKGVRIFYFVIISILSFWSTIVPISLFHNLFRPSFNSLIIWTLTAILLICQYISISNAFKIGFEWRKDRFNLFSSIIDKSVNRLFYSFICVLIYILVSVILYGMGALYV